MGKIVDVIQYEGNNRTFVYKSEYEDFNTLSQLIVHESQEALFFMNGQALDLFGPGRYTLHTQNIPLLSKLINIPTGGVTPFHCEVYFINKTEQMSINWGMGDVNFLDPTHNDYAFKIGASGEMSLRVSDSRKLITKLVGTETFLDQNTLRQYFKAPLTTHIKTLLPNILRNKGVSIFEVEAYLTELSATLKSCLCDEIADYGVSLEKFWINTIVKPENDPFYITLNRQRGERITIVNQGELDLQRAEFDRQVDVLTHSGDVQKQRMDIDTKRYEQEQLGYTFQQKESFEVMKRLAENEGSGSDLQNAAMGIGIGLGAGGAFGGAMQNIAQNVMIPQTETPAAPAQPTPAAEDDMAAFKTKLDKLMMLKEAGLLTDEELIAQKAELLRQITG